MENPNEEGERLEGDAATCPTSLCSQLNTQPLLFKMLLCLIFVENR